MAGTIHRKKKESNFIMLDKTALNDKSLSWKAKGLHSYLMGLPDDWKINVADLTNRSTDGKDSTAAGLNELIKAGYITRKRLTGEGGLFQGYDYDVLEEPISGLSVGGSTITGKTVYGKPVTNKNTVKEGLKEVSNNSLSESENSDGVDNNGISDLEAKKPKEEKPSPTVPAAKPTKPKPEPIKTDFPEKYVRFNNPDGIAKLWARWVKFRKDIKHPIKSEDQAYTALKRLYEWSKGDVLICTQIVEKSIANGWRGLVEPQTPRPSSFTPGEPAKQVYRASEALQSTVQPAMVD